MYKKHSYRSSICFTVTALAVAVLLLFGNLASAELPVFKVDEQKEPPIWALYQRQLIDTLNQAGIEFYDTYVEEDGTLAWKERYEGGMNSSDDAYEAFRGFSLLTALGGSVEIDRRHRYVWEGITKQFTRYGQIYREFDSNWDWMHHGEGYISLYPMGMVDPDDAKFIDRAVRFAAMYTGEDPESPNWDPELKIIRSVMNGSRGPKMEWVKRDWIPTNANLTYYPLPFFDIPGVDASTAWINDHPDNDQLTLLVKAMSDRMAKGDVPINLASTALIANAYLYTGEEKYVQWVKDYVGTWERVTRENGGITPDNIGLSGKIGEYTGFWWGGYYGWVWPRGGTDVVYATLTSAKVATLLTGERRYSELPRSQMAVMREQGRFENGEWIMPIRHDQRGWYHYSSEIAYPYVNLWYLYHEEEDWKNIQRLAEAELKQYGRIKDPNLGWAYFVRGKNPNFPVEAFQADFRFVAEKMETIRNENGDPETWVDNKWINHDPVRMDNLVRLTIGAMPIHKRGEMLHAQVRYFDPVNKRAGLPSDIAALVSRIEADWIQIDFSNINQFERRQLVIQGGAYGEHQIEGIRIGGSDEEVINAQAVTLDVAPGAGFSIRLFLDRYHNKPSYDFPWN